MCCIGIFCKSCDVLPKRSLRAPPRADPGEAGGRRKPCLRIRLLADTLLCGTRGGERQMLSPGQLNAVDHLK